MQIEAPGFLAGGGRVGELMRSTDWTSSSIGDPSAWPHALRVMLSACLNSPMLGAVLWGPDLLMFYNDAYVPSLGDRHPRALGRPVAEVWGLTWDQVSAPFIYCMQTGEGFETREVELLIVRNGVPTTTFWDFTATAIRDDGAIVGLLNQGIEITDRVLAERLREREAEQFWALSEDLLVVADYEGSLIRVSPSWLKLTGKPERDLLTGHYTGITHADDVDRSMSKIARMRDDHLPARFENRLLGADGSWQTIAWSLTPVPGGERFTAVGRNLTHEREAEAALRDTQDFVRLALSAVGGVGVWTYDVATDTFFCDAAISALYGLDPERGAAGLKRAEFLANVVPDDVSPLRNVMTGGLSRAGDLELEYRIQHPDGSIRWVLSRGHTYHGEDGVAVRRTGVGIDMTKQRLLEEQLRQSQKMEALGQLTGGIAHDFNNLLTVIRGSADLLRRPDVTDQKRRRYIDAVADTADRAAKLTSQLLSFARRQALKPQVFDAGESVLALRDMITTLMGSRVDLAVEAGDCPCHVRADRSQFDTAIVNMAVNARDAMESEGRLVITVSEVDGIPAVRAHPDVTGRFVTVSLADTGPGIPADRIDRIFEPFFTTKAVGQGTGLGLSQVFGFAKQSEGEIIATSVEGSGTTFVLYLPAVEEGDLSSSDGLRGETAELPNDLCVLVVEDNREVGTFATQALAELGVEAAWAEDAAVALKMIDREPSRFGIVFSDVVMPGMSGIELGQELRSRHPTLPVLLASGYSNVLATSGSHGFPLLHKPYSVAELSESLRNILSRGPKPRA